MMIAAYIVLVIFFAAFAGTIAGRALDEQVRSWRWRRQRRRELAASAVAFRDYIAEHPEQRCGRCREPLIAHRIVTNAVGSYAACADLEN
jgi:hypothetical protein